MDERYQGDNMPNEIKEPEDPKCYSLLEYLLFKIDRTIAICGLILIALLSMWIGIKLGLAGKDLPESVGSVLSLVVNGLSFYLGVRLGSK